MANTSSLGSEWKPTAWRDGENVPRTTLPDGSPVFSFDASAAAQGTANVQQINATTPIKSTTVNTATTIVAPATTSVIWRVTAWYYAAV